MAKVYRRVCDIDQSKLSDGDKAILRYYDGETDRHVKLDLCNAHKNELHRRMDKYLDAGVALFRPDAERQDESQVDRELTRAIKDWLVEFGYYGSARRGRISQKDRTMYEVWVLAGKPRKEVWEELARQSHRSADIAQMLADARYAEAVASAELALKQAEEDEQERAVTAMTMVHNVQPGYEIPAAVASFPQEWQARPLEVERGY